MSGDDTAAFASCCLASLFPTEHVVACQTGCQRSEVCIVPRTHPVALCVMRGQWTYGAGDAGPCRGSQNLLKRPVGAKHSTGPNLPMSQGRMVEASASLQTTCEASALFAELKAGNSSLLSLPLCLSLCRTRRAPRTAAHRREKQGTKHNRVRASILQLQACLKSELFAENGRATCR